MGQSTDGQLCYGVVFPENQDFPWGDDISDWWRHRIDFDEAHPSCPVELVNYCSDDAPMWILAVPGTMIVAHRGYPEDLGRGPTPHLKPVDPKAKQRFQEFLRQYLGCDDEPRWYMSSYWY